jgi:tRNA/tmRNA/rRNA uracil-C5-methylase (TrmA/RlmC/RlmD family)
MIFKQIKEKLKSQDKPQLSKALGYNNQKNFEKTLEHFLNCSTLHEWLESGNYDFVNQTQEFFTKLAKELNIDEQLIKESLEKENSYIKETERFKDSYIFVNTNFRRTTQPIFILAFCESTRNLRLYKAEELFFKSTEEILEILSKRIQEHYKENKGELVIWGKIVNYQVHLEGKTYIFDINGNLQKNTYPVFESKATLSLR